MHQILEVFFNYIKQLDIEHAAKSVYKKIKAIVKLGCSNLKGYAERIKMRFQSVAYECKRNVDKFCKNMDISLQYWCENVAQITMKSLKKGINH